LLASAQQEEYAGRAAEGVDNHAARPEKPT
jgi:hypothetical protein